jgi:predicted metalloprotease
MKWQRRGRSANVEDRRGQGRGRMRMPLPAGKGPRLGLGGIVMLVGVAWLLGLNPLTLLGEMGGASQVGIDPFPQQGRADVGSGSAASSPAEEEQVEFVSFVLDDVQDSWQRLLPGYRSAKLVLYRGATRSGCGVGQAQMGPFYCPADQKVYVDLGFYDELRSRFGAPGDFAQAYVLAHEIGHHVQHLTGIEEQIRAAQKRRPDQANALSVKMELQADCLAGVWGHAANQRGVLEPGDVEEGLTAASAIGDDRIQEMSGRGVHPESFTHGSSAERVDALRRGLRAGDPAACEAFLATR